MRKVVRISQRFDQFGCWQYYCRMGNSEFAMLLDSVNSKSLIKAQVVSNDAFRRLRMRPRAHYKFGKPFRRFKLARKYG